MSPCHRSISGKAQASVYKDQKNTLQRLRKKVLLQTIIGISLVPAGLETGSIGSRSKLNTLINRPPNR